MPVSPILAPPASRIPPRLGAVGRELAPRTDRLALDARVDLPEIQESWRVSFSDGARVGPAVADREAGQAPAGERQARAVAVALASYRQIAEL